MNLLQYNASNRPSLSQIIDQTCHDQCVRRRDILNHDRSQYLVWARALIAVRARNHGYSYPAIAKAMNRDHTSIMNLCGYRKDRPKEDRRKNAA